MALLRFLKSSSLLRYTLVHTSIMALLCILILALISKFSLGYYRQHQDLFVFKQTAKLQSVAEQEDHQAFLAALESMVLNNRNALVVLKSEEGYYGNLNYLPDSVPASPHVGSFTILDDSGLAEQRFQKVRGSRITTRWGEVLVAYNASDFNLFANRFQLALYTAMLLALLAGSFSGFLFAKRLLGRLGEINRISGEVKAGKLSARAPVSHRNDEFDELASCINDMLEQIENGMEAIASVTDNIAHDLRTPLSRLCIRLDDELALEPDNAEQLLMLRGELDTILRTFNAMLELSRLEHGRKPVSFITCNLRTLSADVVELAEPLAECKNQQIVLEPGGDFILQGNRELLFRALYNLVENAMKYSPEGEAIHIKVDSDSVKIIDQGPGIPEIEQEKVFRRLYRLDRSRKEKGFGLGLSLVKAVATLHGLNIELANNKGLCVSLLRK